MKFLLQHLYWWLVPIVLAAILTTALWLAAREVWPPVIVTEF